MELFRKEVLESQNNRLYGDVTLTRPLSSWVVVGLIGSILLAMVVIIFTGHFAQKETVAGWLQPDKGIVRIIAPQLSSVKQVHVIEGQEIVAGDPLVTLGLDTSLLNGDRAINVSLAAIELQIEERKRIAKLTSQKFIQMEQSLAEDLNFAKAEYGGLSKRSEILQSRIEASSVVLERYERLEKGQAASLLEVERQKDNLLVLKQTSNQIDQQKIIKKAEISRIKNELSAIPLSLEESLIENSQVNSSLISQRAKLLRQSAVILDAPISGRVSALTVTNGQSLRPQDMVMSLLPRGGQLKAELFVPTRAAGFIRNGQDVMIQYHAFPYQKYGYSSGKITSISKTIFEPRNVPESIQQSEPVYRVVVTIKEQSVDVSGEQFPLQSGMTLTADIVKQKRRLLDFVLDVFRPNTAP
ncbi:MAG: HlyD family efflux transporter periplasmic adaptor subunit [Hellea sp.]